MYIYIYEYIYVWYIYIHIYMYVYKYMQNILNYMFANVSHVPHIDKWRDVTRINTSCHSYQRVTSHTSRHTHQNVMSHQCQSHFIIVKKQEKGFSHMSMSCHAYRWVTCHTHQRVILVKKQEKCFSTTCMYAMWRISMSRVSHIKASSQVPKISNPFRAAKS